MEQAKITACKGATLFFCSQTLPAHKTEPECTAAALPSGTIFGLNRYDFHPLLIAALLSATGPSVKALDGCWFYFILLFVCLSTFLLSLVENRKKLSAHLPIAWKVMTLRKRGPKRGSSERMPNAASEAPEHFCFVVLGGVQS